MKWFKRIIIVVLLAPLFGMLIIAFCNLTIIQYSKGRIYDNVKEIPYKDFSAENLPYLYGIDLSNNALEAFPKAPLGIESLTVISVRCQRDDAGNRTLKEWPVGIGNCPKLAALYIGSNDIGKVEDTISPYILIFEIKDNPNIDITLSKEVCDLIRKNYYLLVYDSTQNIKGCDALNLD